MSTSSSPKQAFSADGLRLLNQLCDEFRRRLKQSALESPIGSAGVVDAECVLAASDRAGVSSWLIDDEELSDHEEIQRAA